MLLVWKENYSCNIDQNACPLWRNFCVWPCFESKFSEIGYYTLKEMGRLARVLFANLYMMQIQLCNN